MTIFKSALSYILLPAEVTAFEREHLKRMNRIGLIFFYLHVPVFMGVAAIAGTGPVLACVLSLGVLIGPTVAYRAFRNVRAMSAVFGFTAMCMGGLLVHFGQGRMQIEMHFYFFVLLALLAVFGNPLAIIVAAVTVALHHLLLWVLLPSSVFNYDASIWSVVVHALFVVLESIAACFVARSFFDNVIGLERIVGERTRALDQRNEDLRLVLDNVGQGFLTLNRNGGISKERSAMVDRWLGAPSTGERFSDCLSRTDVKLGAWFQLAFDGAIEDVLPIDLSIDQLPKRIKLGDRSCGVEYRPIYEGGSLSKVLMVVSDLTVQLEREALESEQRETVQLFERIMRDKAGFLEFFGEGQAIMDRLNTQPQAGLITIKREVHTLKGNASLFGLNTLAQTCHVLEDEMAETGAPPSAGQLMHLERSWAAVVARVETFMGDRTEQQQRIELDSTAYEAVLAAALRGAPRDELVRIISSWRLEPTEKRLARIAEQTRSIARRLKKQVEIRLHSNEQRLPREEWVGLWSSFVHLARNAVDHGLESEDERILCGKPAAGTIDLGTFIHGGELVIEIADDGRGIDWNKVKAFAVERGLPHHDRKALLEALLSDGFTTRCEVTEDSGRGVGLSAVRRAAEERGGRLELISEAGRGTKVQLRFPGEVMLKGVIPRTGDLRVEARPSA